ncbi:MAG: hypothetical protein ACREO3_09455, partial [Arenimonas sp.]
MNAQRAPAELIESHAWPVEALQFAPGPADQIGWRRERVVVGIGVLVLHVLFAWLLESQSQRRTREDARPDAAIVVTYIETLPRQWIRASDQRPAPGPARQTPATPRPHASPPPAPPTPRAVDAPLRLYRPDGSLRLPDGLIEDLDRSTHEPRFAFQMPDLDKAAHLLDRPPALVYEPTRFDEYWEPNEDLLTEVLRKAVEKTTKEVRIPIPGARGRFLVCRVSLLAAGGACGMERNGGNAVVAIGDPKTLDATEAAACAAWWNRIIGASTQAEWRATRKLYEAECLK